MKVAIILCVSVICYYQPSDAHTPVEKCSKGKTPEQLKQSITIGNCKKTPCKFQKRHRYVGEYKFTPDREIKSLTNRIYATPAGTTLQLPFIPYDGESVCDTNVYEADGTTKTKCPLVANKEYVYKISLEILDIFPEIDVLIHWALTAHDGQDAVCFEAKAKIRKN